MLRELQNSSPHKIALLAPIALAAAAFDPGSLFAHLLCYLRRFPGPSRVFAATYPSMLSPPPTEPAMRVLATGAKIIDFLQRH